MSIGGEFDLDILLDRCLPIFLRKLNCTLAGVIQVEGQAWETVKVLPSIMIHMPQWMQVAADFSTRFISNHETCPELVSENRRIYGFCLNDFGLLILSRSSEFNTDFQKELLPVVDQLARACRSCLEAQRRREAEERLLFTQAQQKALLDNLPFMAWLKDDQGRYLAVNQIFIAECGRSMDEIIGRTTLEVWPGLLGTGFQEQDKHVLNSGEQLRWEQDGGADNPDKWMEYYKAPVLEPGGKIVGLAGFRRDITENKRRELELESQKKLVNALVDNAPASIWLRDAHGGLLLVNKLFQGQTGIGTDNLSITKDELAVCDQTDSLTLEADEPQQFEEHITFLDGNRHILQTIKSKLLMPDGKTMAILGLGLDITDRRRMEEELRQSEERYRGIVESQADLVVRVDNQGRFTFVNEAYCRTFGKTREELIGRTFMPLVHEDDLPATMKAMQALERPPHRTSLEQRAMSVDGWRWLAWEDFAIKDENGTIMEIQGVGRDITALKEAEIRLRFQADLEALLAQISTRFINLGAENMNQAVQSCLGEIGELLKVDRVYVFQCALDHRFWSNTYEWCARGIPPQINKLQDIPLDILPWWHDKMSRLENIVIPDMTALPPEAEAEKQFLEDQEILSLLAVPMIWDSALEGFIGFDSVRQPVDWRPADAVPLEMLASILINALKRKETEQRLMQSQMQLQELNVSLEAQVEVRTRQLGEAQRQLILGEKMAAIGQLAAGIAHELNNPVGFVSMNFQTLEEYIPLIVEVLRDYKQALNEPPGSAKQQQLLDKARALEEESAMDVIMDDTHALFDQSREGFRRITTIVNSMRDFSRTDPREEFVHADLNKGLRDTLVIARNSYKSIADIELDLGEIPHVECIPGQINQVFLNIIINAAQAMANAELDQMGIIRIQTWFASPDVFCAITNSGPVIPDQIRGKLFDPFFTTKPPGQGTGLGLSISHDIVVRTHNGSLTVSSDAEKGTTFLISLPMKQAIKKKGLEAED